MHVYLYAYIIHTYYYTIIFNDKTCTSCKTLIITEPGALICSSIPLITWVEAVLLGPSLGWGRWGVAPWRPHSRRCSYGDASLRGGGQRPHRPSFGSPLEDPLGEFVLPPRPCFLGDGLKVVGVSPAPGLPLRDPCPAPIPQPVS